MCDPATWVAIGTAIVGTTVTITEGQKASRAQKKTRRAQRRIQSAKQARERQQVVAEARRKRASSIATAESQGISQSSAVEGATGSLTSQTSQTTNFLDTQSALVGQANSFLDQAASAQQASSLGSAVSNVALTVFDNRDLFK